MEETMKDRFGLYMPDANTIKTIWNDAIFIYDANVLLDLYRFSELARNQLLEVFSGLASKSWLPNQSLLEFSNNRIEVIRDLEMQYDEIINFTQKNLSLSTIENFVKGVESRHPYIQLEYIVAPIEKALSEIQNKMNELKTVHPITERDDRVLDALRSIFHDNIGEPYTTEQLDAVYCEADKRYKAKVPPGYKDSDKPTPRKYGDVVFWYQVIDFAKSKKQPVILVTGDKKEDWWLKNGPIRPELIEEFRKKTGMKIWAYKPKNFIGYAGEYLSLEVRQATTETNAIQNSRDREYQSYNQIRDMKFEQRMIAERIREAEINAKRDMEENRTKYYRLGNPLTYNAFPISLNDENDTWYWSYNFPIDFEKRMQDK